MRWRVIAVVSLGVNVALAAVWLLPCAPAGRHVFRRDRCSSQSADQSGQDQHRRPPPAFHLARARVGRLRDLRRQSARHRLPGANHSRHHHRRRQRPLRAQTGHRAGHRGPTMVAQRAGPGGRPQPPPRKPATWKTSGAPCSTACSGPTGRPATWSAFPGPRGPGVALDGPALGALSSRYQAGDPGRQPPLARAPGGLPGRAANAPARTPTRWR